MQEAAIKVNLHNYLWGDCCFLWEDTLQFFAERNWNTTAWCNSRSHTFTGSWVSRAVLSINSSQHFQLVADTHGLNFGMSFRSLGKSIFDKFAATVYGRLVKYIWGCLITSIKLKAKQKCYYRACNCSQISLWSQPFLVAMAYRYFACSEVPSDPQNWVWIGTPHNYFECPSNGSRYSSIHSLTSRVYYYETE